MAILYTYIERQRQRIRLKLILLKITRKNIVMINILVLAINNGQLIIFLSVAEVTVITAL